MEEVEPATETLEEVGAMNLEAAGEEDYLTEDVEDAERLKNLDLTNWDEEKVLACFCL